MPIEDRSVRRKLLSPTSDKVRFENEMSTTGSDNSDPETDLRLHDLAYDHEDAIDEIIELLEESPHLIFAKDQDGRTPLHTLCIAGDDDSVQIAELFLGVVDGKAKRKEILEISDSRGFTALHYSTRNWLPDLTECLLKHGASPSAKDLQGNSPLHFAAEGGTPNAVKCAKLLLDHDKNNGFLINAKNDMEQTPLHCAVKEQAVLMVELLMGQQYKLNFNLSTSANGQTILHYLCQECGETERSCKIFANILSTSKERNVPQFNLVDGNARTPLHISAIRRLPRITEMLNSEKDMDVLKIDKRKRTALHYACENGAYPNGYKCVEALLDRKFKKAEDNKLICYLYQMRDKQENSAFMYAALNCPVDTIGKYLIKIPEPQFWMNEMEIALVYKQCPLAIKSLMDHAFSEQELPPNSDEKLDEIMVDFGPITGYSDPVEKLSQQESKYLKNALWWSFSTQKEILMHPLVQLYVAKKCTKLRSMIYGWILWQLIWLAAYTILIYSVYTKDLPNSTWTYISTSVVLIYIIVSSLNELFELTSVGLMAYILCLSNIFQVVQVFLGCVAIYPVLASESEPSGFCRTCAAVGILIAHVLSMRDFGKLHEKIGYVIEILKQIVIEIVKVLICCFMLVLGFTHAFKVIFEDEESLKSTFPGPLVKIMVMMTGEFEYNDTFKENGDGHGESTTKLILFLLFLICVPVAFFNLLTGFALDRVMELRERAKVGRIAKLVEHIYFIETILLSLHPLKKILSPKTVVNWLRNHNVTTARIGGDVCFEFLLKEEARKNIDRRTAKERKLDIIKAFKSIFGSDIDSSVRSEILALASSNSTEIRLRRQEQIQEQSNSRN